MTRNSLFDYGRMTADHERVSAYMCAMKAAIKPGDRVLDLGCGSGIFAVFAAKLGASEVIGVEPNYAVNYGPSLARANGVSDRVKFFRGFSQDLVLDEPVDVIVSDLRGSLPLFRKHLQSLQDAKARLLAPSGRMIPIKDRVFAAPVHDERIMGFLNEPWRSNRLDLDLSPIVEIEKSRLWRARLCQGNLRSEPKEWAEIDYQSIDELNYANSLEWVISKHCLVSGLALWFDGELWPGALISNHPAAPPCIYGQTILPFDVLECEPGYLIRAKINAHFLEGEYIWRWDVTVSDEREAVMSFQSRNTKDFSLGSREVECI